MTTRRSCSLAANARAHLGSKLNLFPVPSLQTFASDLTVIQVEADYYFKDIFGNHILITNMDWDIIKQPKGWLLKSAATIDIFGQTGVPVISLFQNFDYGNQYFTKHVAQVVDGNGVETSPAYVSAIVAYSAPLTGTDLTTANTFYGVPEEITAAVKWEDINASTSTETGTKLQPYKTFTKSNGSATAADTVYCKNGIYDENSASLPGSLYLTKSLTFIGIGKTEIQSTGANYVVFISSGDITFKGVLINAEGSKNTGVNVYSTGAKTIIWEKCLFMGANTTHYNGVSVESSSFKNCIVKGLTSKAAQAFTVYASLIDSCYFIDSASNIVADVILKNNNVYHNDKDYCFRVNNNSINAFGNVLNYSGSGIIESTAFTSAKTATIKYNTFNQSDKSIAALLTGIDFRGTVAVIIERNSFRSTALEYLATRHTYIYLSDTVTPEINYNSFVSLSEKSFDHIGILLGGSITIGSAKIQNNYSKSNSLSGVQMSIGYESAYSQKANESIFAQNRVIGFKKENQTGTAVNIHGVLLNCGINNDIKYNFISHHEIGLVVKSNGVAYTGNGIQYNIVSKTSTCLYIRGCGGLNVFNNLLIGNAALHLFKADENTAEIGTQESENIILKNNIFIAENVGGSLLYFDTHAGTTGLVCDYNIYFSAVAKPFTIGATTYSFDEWQALGHDAHSIMLTSLTAAKALFTDFDNENYTLASGSAAIGFGVELESYTTGLDAATTWGSETTIPVIVTKENTSLCAGAYVR